MRQRPHPLLEVLLAAAGGRPPPPDGAVEVLPPPAGHIAAAVVAFTAHSYLLADVDPGLARSRLRDGDPGAPTLPAFLTWLAGQVGARAGQLDAVLVAPGLQGAPPLPLEPRTGPQDHHRVARALRYRSELRVFTSAGGVLVLGRGLAGRWEAAFEVEPEHRGRGLGRALALAARHLVPPGRPLFVQVSPGNAASLRAILAAGYRPLGGEVLFTHSPP